MGRVVTEELSMWVVKANNWILVNVTVSGAKKSHSGEGDNVIWQVLAQALVVLEEDGKLEGWVLLAMKC
jgi:hypothetical protein